MERAGEIREIRGGREQRDTEEVEEVEMEEMGEAEEFIGRAPLATLSETSFITINEQFNDPPSPLDDRPEQRFGEPILRFTEEECYFHISQLLRAISRERLIDTLLYSFYSSALTIATLGYHTAHPETPYPVTLPYLFLILYLSIAAIEEVAKFVGKLSFFVRVGAIPSYAFVWRNNTSSGRVFVAGILALLVPAALSIAVLSFILSVIVADGADSVKRLNVLDKRDIMKYYKVVVFNVVVALLVVVAALLGRRKVYLFDRAYGKVYFLLSLLALSLTLASYYSLSAEVLPQLHFYIYGMVHGTAIPLSAYLISSLKNDIPLCVKRGRGIVNVVLREAALVVLLATSLFVVYYPEREIYVNWVSL